MSATTEPLESVEAAQNVEAVEPAAPAAPEAKKKRSKKPAGDKKPSKKRSPARPYRRLSQELLDGRIGKLSRRIETVSTKLHEAKGFLAKYTREQELRAQAEPADAVV